MKQTIQQASARGFAAAAARVPPTAAPAPTALGPRSGARRHPPARAAASSQSHKPRKQCESAGVWAVGEKGGMTPNPGWPRLQPCPTNRLRRSRAHAWAAPCFHAKLERDHQLGAWGVFQLAEGARDGSRWKRRRPIGARKPPTTPLTGGATRAAAPGGDGRSDGDCPALAQVASSSVCCKSVWQTCGGSSSS